MEFLTLDRLGQLYTRSGQLEAALETHEQQYAMARALSDERQMNLARRGRTAVLRQLDHADSMASVPEGALQMVEPSDDYPSSPVAFSLDVADVRSGAVQTALQDARGSNESLRQQTLLRK
jgi:hypothetical protein